MKSLPRRRILLINGALGVLLLGGVGVAYFSLTDKGADATTSTRTSPVARGTVVSTVSAAGSVESARTRSLAFTASGTVSKITVTAGEKVDKGEVLARLDRTEALENLAAAQANLAAAEEGDTDTTQGYASYIQAKNSYNQALRALDGTVLKAPFAGTVTAVNGTVGGSSSGTGGSGSSSSTGTGESATPTTTTTAGSGFIELADTKRLQVVGEFTEADTTGLKAGQTATITFDALPNVTATGKVAAIDMAPTTTDNVVRYPATIRLTEVPSGVRLGQTATVEITTAEAENALYVPTAAVRTVGGRSTVTVLRSGRSQIVAVTVGVKGDQGTEIKSGLAEGDLVVITSTGSTGTTGNLPGGGFPGGPGGAGGPGGGAGGFGGGRRP